MPKKDITIEAYFETGKAAIGPAAITGIGSVGYKVLDDNGNWKSANTCEPGDKVMVVVTAGNGYKFDDSRYESRLFVTRKDNGAPVVSQESVPRSWSPSILRLPLHHARLRRGRACHLRSGALRHHHEVR